MDVGRDCREWAAEAAGGGPCARDGRSRLGVPLPCWCFPNRLPPKLAPFPLCDLVRFSSGLLSRLSLITRERLSGGAAAAPRNTAALEPSHERFGSYASSSR